MQFIEFRKETWPDAEGDRGMYEDDDLWPLKCPWCSHGFTERIGRVKLRLVSSCPECSLDFAHDEQEFFFDLSEAREGRYNPWWEILSDPPRD